MEFFKLTIMLVTFLISIELETCTGAVSKLSHSFLLNWKVNRTDIVKRGRVQGCYCFKELTVQFDEMDNLSFKLCLLRDNFVDDPIGARRVHLLILSTNSSSLSQAAYTEYAYIASNHEIFNLKESKQTDQFAPAHFRSVLFDMYNNIWNPDGTVTVYAMIRINADVTCNESLSGHLRCKSQIGRPSKLVAPIEECTGELEEPSSNILDEYLFSGKIPIFSIETAKQYLDAIADAQVLTGSNAVELRAMIIQYLMKQTTCKNVVEVLKISVKHKLQVVIDLCLDFLSNSCHIK